MLPPPAWHQCKHCLRMLNCLGCQTNHRHSCMHACMHVIGGPWPPQSGSGSGSGLTRSSPCSSSWSSMISSMSSRVTATTPLSAALGTGSGATRLRGCLLLPLVAAAAPDGDELPSGLGMLGAPRLEEPWSMPEKSIWALLRTRSIFPSVVMVVSSGANETALPRTESPPARQKAASSQQPAQQTLCHAEQQHGMVWMPKHLHLHLHLLLAGDRHRAI